LLLLLLCSCSGEYARERPTPTPQTATDLHAYCRDVNPRDSACQGKESK
jgi:hypothetical protein